MSIPDPIRKTAELIASEDVNRALEVRLKKDIFNSIGRIKPAITETVDFDTEVLDGTFFSELQASLQGIAISRCEGALAFYNRVGWHPEFLTTPHSVCVPESGVDTLSARYHASTLHDLGYVHPKHFEKMLGKTDAAKLWEELKRFSKNPTLFKSAFHNTH